MPDFTTLGGTNTAGFAGSKWRHVVVKHEAFTILALQSIDDLLILLGAQGSNDQRLGLTAGKQYRAMRARQYRGTNADRTHGTGITTINTWLSVQNLSTHNFGFKIK